MAESEVDSDTDLHSLRERLIRVASERDVPLELCDSSILAAWEARAERYLEDGELSENEEAEILAVTQALGLQQEQMDTNPVYRRVVQAALLRDVMGGRVVNRFHLTGGTIPFNLQRQESLLWIFPNTEYLEDRVRREYVGGSSGYSVRVMKGVYLRQSAFRSRLVDATHRVHVDTGLFGVTNKHLYFAGPAKSLRVRFDKIVTYTPYSDGIGIHRDAQTAKPQVFVTGEGWFTYNLVTNAYLAG